MKHQFRQEFGSDFTNSFEIKSTKQFNLSHIGLFFLPVLICLLVFSNSAKAENFSNDPVQSASPNSCSAGAKKVNEEKFVLINGIEQWLTIKGERCDNPVILFLHGGPANPMSPYSEAIYGAWQKNFTLVHWDQRGSGKTFIRNPSTVDQNLSLTQMAADGIAVAQYLRQTLAKDKIVLMGSSWGSALGMQIVKTRSDLFYAYIGTAQIVSQAQNQEASYAKTLAKARAAGDQQTAKTLEEIGSPPWLNPRHFGVLRRATKVYEAKTSTAAPKNWWIPAASYKMEEMEAQYEAGEEYSFLQFVGLKNNGIYSTINFPAMGLVFDIPIFLIQGEEDLVTVPEVSKAYFDQIQAPEKAYVLVPKAGHNPNFASIAMEYAVLNERVLPLIKK
jgi:pimeloyl-ACP methyl ester carboxylesterase